VFEVGDAIAATLEHFELIVEAFGEAARLTARETVRDFGSALIYRMKN
jgi:hypothetical protein